jgi:hypothetical protein
LSETDMPLDRGRTDVHFRSLGGIEHFYCVGDDAVVGQFPDTAPPAPQPVFPRRETIHSRGAG